MKVVKFQELAQMPKGIIFCEWEPCIASHWYVKGESSKFGTEVGDWLFYELSLEPECDEAPDDQPKLHRSWIKRLEVDPLAGADQLFAVLEDDERLFMIHMLTMLNA